MRGIEDVSWCSILGIAGMAVALVIASVKLVLLRVDDYTPTQWLRRFASCGGAWTAESDVPEDISQQSLHRTD